MEQRRVTDARLTAVDSSIDGLFAAPPKKTRVFAEKHRRLPIETRASFGMNTGVFRHEHGRLSAETQASFSEPTIEKYNILIIKQLSFHRSRPYHRPNTKAEPAAFVTSTHTRCGYLKVSCAVAASKRIGFVIIKCHPERSEGSQYINNCFRDSSLRSE